MALKTKFKWIALIGFSLSALSLATHFLIARFFTASQVEVSAQEIQTILRWTATSEDSNYGKVWSKVKTLQNIRPYSAPRKGYPTPTRSNNGFLVALIEGDFHEIRSSICDFVLIARLLNVTLVIPELLEVSSATGISSTYRGFNYIYDEMHFIMTLKRDVSVVKSLPKKHSGIRKQKMSIKSSPASTPSFYMKTFLPILKERGAVYFVISGGGCLQSKLPEQMVDYQRLRCRVAFEALRFRKEVQELGFRMVQRLQALGQPYLAYHPGLERDSLAFHGCAERFQDLHTELIQYTRALMIKEGLVKANLSIDSELQWKNGSCPLLPEEVGVLLRALGHVPHTRIYISGSEIFGGQRVLIPLRAMFHNLEDRTTLTTEEEMAAIFGPEEALPPPMPPPPPPSPDELKKLLATWEVAGPRPRPLPPPPSRNIYAHEFEGWWSWLTVSNIEPQPSLAEFRLKGRKLLWAALDYIICVEATAFFPGFDRDRNGRPNFASLVMGHRAYLSPSSRTYHPNRRSLAKLLANAEENLYPPSMPWTMSARKELKASLDFIATGKFLFESKESSFLSHPFPECYCQLSTKAQSKRHATAKRSTVSQVLNEICPRWIENDVRFQIDSETDEDDGLDILVPDISQRPNNSSTLEEPLVVEIDRAGKEESQSDIEDEGDAND
ncbi:hypothetical protein KP509_06G084800 [Ceratopteris richardii]|uniref:O-fucosyltransferase family protein n=1 Tax=Ceratopteris richardii TaxID=49495 RepID=A0A8T2UN24_CERRI|nr:hypothetical protein KP509_06G084800 [Ceratopteris richardii]